MIDNRPVFNNNMGGTFWESLPVGINDVERIEIVRGPSAPLFGPNAVSGVINIITRKVENGKMLVTGSLQAGMPNTTLANASVGKNFGKWSVLASANAQQRNRFDSEYYQNSTGLFVPGSEINSDFAILFPNSEKAAGTMGVNSFIGYKPLENVSLDLSMGTQNSQVQKIFLGGNGTRFSTNETTSGYANLAATISNLTVRTSYNAGNENLNVGSKPNQYDFAVADANIEYAFKFNDKISVSPGFSYQYVKFDDNDYRVDGSNPSAGFLNGAPSITTVAGFVRTDVSVTDNWRVLAAVRADKFSSPDKTYLAYELASTYKLNENNLVRFAVTRSNSGSFMGYTYLNIQVPTPVPGLAVQQLGNTDLKLFTIDMIEVGFRSKLTRNLQLDIDLFNQRAENFTAITAEEFNPIINTTSVYRFNNLPTTAMQNGATLGFNFVPNDKLQFKPFVTVQQTETRDLPSSFASPALDPSVTYSDGTHKSTPSVFGGYYFNFKASRKFNFNVNSYYFAKHRQYDNTDANETSAEGEIKGKLLVNFKANWSVTPKLNVFVNGRNALNSNTREFFGTDRIGGVYLAGVSFSFH
jgi:iron complex outermembrane receptor protein